MTGRIFNIQRFSIHDGPGVRTTVFFKGCNLHCMWCHNPESISYNYSLEFYPDKCIGCGSCFYECEHEAHRINEDGEHIIDRDKCVSCLKCADSCFAGALCGVGCDRGADYILKQIETDIPYYGEDGGVTFSGGECMLQIDFLEELLKKCREKGIRTAVDTAGNVPWDYFERILPYADLFLYDVKAADSGVHKALTGASNERIVENLTRLAESGKDIIVRIPFIPGKNDGELEKIAGILESIKPKLVEVLPYHKLGGAKYSALELHDEMKNASVPDDETVENAVKLLLKHGINARRT